MGEPARLLIAEDEEAVRAYLIRALVGAGYQVTAVADGRAALEAMQQERFDLLLTDIRMPRLDGIELALQAGLIDPDMRILMMTGYPHERQRAHNIDALSHRVLSKPFEIAELREAVAEVLASPPG